MAYQDFDFMGFTYNGKHSYRDLGIYRVSGGDRYEETFTPTFQEKTSQIDGMVGSYYFGQNISNRQFNISFAFDHLTEQGVRKLKQTFNGDGIHDLIFDEYPYKVYSAKVTGSATLKTICFELEEGRVYRGEGTITFTCYYPYAHTPHSLLGEGTSQAKTIDITYSYNNASKKWVSNVGNTRKVLECGIVVNGDCTYTIPKSDNGYSLIQEININYYAEGKKQTKKQTYSRTTRVGEGLIFKASNGNAYIDTIEYVFYTNPADNAFSGAGPITKNLVMSLSNEDITYTYSKIGSNQDYCYRPGLILNPKVINHYASYYYPTKKEWYEASGLPLHIAPIKNVGDLPIPFVVRYNPTSAAESDTDTTLTVNGKSTTFKRKEDTDYTWNSKTGTVCKKTNEIDKPIAATGDICYEIPVKGDIGVSVTGGNTQDVVQLEYDIWYY